MIINDISSYNHGESLSWWQFRGMWIPFSVIPKSVACAHLHHPTSAMIGIQMESHRNICESFRDVFFFDKVLVERLWLSLVISVISTALLYMVSIKYSMHFKLISSWFLYASTGHGRCRGVAGGGIWRWAFQQWQPEWIWSEWGATMAGRWLPCKIPIWRKDHGWGYPPFQETRIFMILRGWFGRCVTCVLE